MSVQKFCTLLEQSDCSILFFLENEHYNLRYCFFFYVQGGFMACIRLETDLFSSKDLPSSYPRYGLKQKSENCAPSHYWDFYQKVMKEEWKHFPFSHESQKQLYHHVQFTLWEHGLFYDSSFLYLISNIPVGHVGYIPCVSFEHFCEGKHTLPSVLSSIQDIFLSEISQFYDHEWEPQESVFQKAKCFLFLESFVTRYQEYVSEYQRTSSLLTNLFQIYKDLEQRLLRLEEESQSWSFEESLYYTKQKRQLFRHLDQLQLLKKYVMELLWLLHLQKTGNFVICMMYIRQYHHLHQRIQEFQQFSLSST